MSHIVYAIDLSKPELIEDPDVLAKRLSDPKKPIWVHMDYHDPETLPWLKKLGVEQDDLEILMNPETRPRYLISDDRKTSILLTRGVNFNPNEKQEDMVSLRTYMSGNNLITIRLRKVFAVEDTQKKVLSDNKPLRIEDVWFKILENIITRITPVLYDMEALLEKIDAGKPKNLILAEQEMSSLRQKMIGFKRFLRPQVEALQDLNQTPPVTFTGDDQKDVADILDKQLRITEWIEAMREQAVVAHEQVMSFSTHKMNKITYILTVVAGIFLPLNFIGALLGANVGGVPWSDNPDGFAIMSAILFGIAFIQYILMRLFRWF